MLVSDSDSTAPSKGATKNNDSRNDTDSSGLHNICDKFSYGWGMLNTTL